MHRAFELSESHRLPVVVRITRALSIEPEPLDRPLALPKGSRARYGFERKPGRYNVLPIRVVDFHHELQASLARVQDEFEHSTLNSLEGAGKRGIIAAGQVGHKLDSVLARSGMPDLQILRLSTLNPLPEGRITNFLRTVEKAVVLEETAPHIETQAQAIAQRAGLELPIYGRSSGHLPSAGELGQAHIALALTSILPGWDWPTFDPISRAMPSRRSLCQECPYIPAFDSLLKVMNKLGGRDAFVVTGETGCMVRAQLPPWEILDVKYGMGSSIGLASGLARAGISQHLIALSGDSALLHSGLGELIDAVQADLRLMVVLLENSTTALSGGQPHPASEQDANRRPRDAVDMTALVRASGARQVQVVDPSARKTVESAYEEGLARDGVSVVIIRGPCPEYV
jgi:indolepyruvate ferredoxin oxidoreductase alpha subunit